MSGDPMIDVAYLLIILAYGAIAYGFGFFIGVNVAEDAAEDRAERFRRLGLECQPDKTL